MIRTEERARGVSPLHDVVMRASSRAGRQPEKGNPIIRQSHKV